MLSLLQKWFIKDPNNRQAMGSLCGAVGIGLNGLLCALKLLAGALSGSLAIAADGLNNLSDALSSLVSLAGFRISAKTADREHPFGHGRAEYVSALIVGFLILLMGAELGKSSLERLIGGSDAPLFSPVTFLVLGASLLIKLYMGLFNRKYGKSLQSSVLLAASQDSFFDMAATTAVLLSAAVNALFHVDADPWCGLLVSLFILWGGGKSVFETCTLLLGKPADKALTEKITARVLDFEGIEGVHDLVIHDYGPGRFMLTLHAEMNGELRLKDAHTLIDKVEQALDDEFGCLTTIHMDPATEQNPQSLEALHRVRALLLLLGEGCSVHDFHLTHSRRKLVLTFDAAVPYALPLSDREITERLTQGLCALDERYEPRIHIDRREA